MEITNNQETLELFVHHSNSIPQFPQSAPPDQTRLGLEMLRNFNVCLVTVKVVTTAEVFEQEISQEYFYDL